MRLNARGYVAFPCVEGCHISQASCGSHVVEPCWCYSESWWHGPLRLKCKNDDGSRLRAETLSSSLHSICQQSTLVSRNSVNMVNNQLMLNNTLSGLLSTDDPRQLVMVWEVHSVVHIYRLYFWAHLGLIVILQMLRRWVTGMYVWGSIRLCYPSYVRDVPVWHCLHILTNCIKFY